MLLSILLGINLYALLSGKTYFYKAIRYNFAGVDDYKLFENRTIRKSTQPQPWLQSTSFNQKAISSELKSTLDSLETFAFLIIKNDSIVYESYSDGYGTSSYSNSFSVAKSVVGILVGAALRDGKIKHIDQPVADFLPNFEGEKSKITIRHLLTMSSGLNWDESYTSPFSMTTEAYYGDDLPKLISKLEAIEEPGKVYNYLSGNTQLLGLIVEKATGKHLSEYAEAKLWQPMGMENDALWCLDKANGTEKAYCCINSNARDFARLGKLYLNKGNWNGIQIVDTAFVNESTQPASLLDPDDKQPIDYYGLHWWLYPDCNGMEVFYARGILGQYIIVIPEENIIIVRLGQKRGPKEGREKLSDVRLYVKEALNL